jgi:HlyD family secretion protein
MSPMRKRVLIWLAVAGLLGAGLFVAFRPQPVAVDLVTIEPAPMAVTVSEEGRTQVHDMYVLSAPVSGRVQRIDAHAGDRVVAGETVLARIEPSEPGLLDPRTEAEAQAAVRAAESALALAQAEVRQAAADQEFAQSDWQRAGELVANGTISRRDFDEAERSYKSTTAGLATARAALQVRMFELEQARARLMAPSGARRPYDDCECVPITAPVSGQVMQIGNPSSRTVSAGEPLMEIGDSRHLEIIADFLSADAVRISPGQEVIINDWGGDRPLAGRVRLVEPFGFTKISALGIEEQRVNVTIDFVSGLEKRQRLGHGYQVEVQVVLWESGAVLAVPLTALFRQGEDWAVFVSLDGKARLRAVKVGHRNGLVAEVLQGLNRGDRVLAHLSDRIHDGSAITQREAN